MFVGREGEEVAAPGVTLVDDPTIPDALGAASHDAEGVPTRRVDLIVDGRLLGFLHNTYTGRRSGGGDDRLGGARRLQVDARGRRPGAAPGARHARARRDPGVGAEALYVQSVSGLHSGTNPVSGDFSVGAEGLMVRGGEFAEPVREVTIASTLQRMLLDVVEVGSDLTWLPGGGAGLTLLVTEMTMSGE